MNEKHYKQELSAYVNDELAQDRRVLIAEHILQCEPCREEHDSIRRVADLAGALRQADAPVGTWSHIESAMAGGGRRGFSFFGVRSFATAGVGLILLTAIAATLYLTVLRNRGQQMAGGNAPQMENPRPAPIAPTAPPIPQVGPTNPDVAEVPPPAPPKPGSGPTVRTPSTLPGPNRSPELSASMAVETISGSPRVGNSPDARSLAVGEYLVTDANSRASIAVADIGKVEVAPNSRVRLVNTTAAEHRLSLERGQVHAIIDAPPRLFIVDTPSAVAVDLGCEYTLEVDQAGNSKLHVTAGFVSLERDGRESVVPAGAFCLTRKGKGIGTPYVDGATSAFRDALFKFDFEGGGSASLSMLLRDAGAEDSLTLWHLLVRVTRADRERVFAALSAYAELPQGVTREGILNLDKKMLEAWRESMQHLWYQ